MTSQKTELTSLMTSLFSTSQQEAITWAPDVVEEMKLGVLNYPVPVSSCSGAPRNPIVTAVCIVVGDHATIWGPRHGNVVDQLSHPIADVALLPPLPNEKYHCFNITNYVAKPRSAETIFTVSNKGVWVGHVMTHAWYPAFPLPLPSCSREHMPNTSLPHVPMVLASGTQADGMSGAPVINGCGHVGTAVIRVPASGTESAGIVPTSVALQLYSSVRIKSYYVPQKDIEVVEDIRIKSYCTAGKHYVSALSLIPDQGEFIFKPVLILLIDIHSYSYHARVLMTLVTVHVRIATSFRSGV